MEKASETAGVTAVIARPLRKLWQKATGMDPWDETGRLQFDFLVKEGLKPDHRFLDVGCGDLRGGVHFIRYLGKGRYVGVDRSKRQLAVGRRKLRKYRLLDKTALLVEMADFDLPSLHQRFDYALAQSVFTHLSLNSIMLCLINIEKVLVPGGRFYATFYENPEGRGNLRPIARAKVGRPDLLTYFDRDPYHYDFQTFERACEDTTLRVQYMGSWGHPRDQRMLVFLKS